MLLLFVDEKKTTIFMIYFPVLLFDVRNFPLKLVQRFYFLFVHDLRFFGSLRLQCYDYFLRGLFMRFPNRSRVINFPRLRCFELVGFRLHFFAAMVVVDIFEDFLE